MAGPVKHLIEAMIQIRGALFAANLDPKGAKVTIRIPGQNAALKMVCAVREDDTYLTVRNASSDQSSNICGLVVIIQDDRTSERL